MATNFWLGNAPAVAQVDRITVSGTPTVGLTYAVTISNKTVTFTATATETTAALAAAALYALLTSGSFGEFREQSYAFTVGNAYVDATSTLVGRPFTMSVGGTGSIARATTAASSGPNDAGIAGNWSLGNVPAVGDDVEVANSTVSILWNLQAVSGTRTTIRVRSYSGDIGLPPQNPLGFLEYRPTTLKLKGSNLTVGPLVTSRRVRIDLDGSACAIQVSAPNTAPDPITAAVTLSGTIAGSNLTVTKGNVGLALDTAQTAVLDNLRITYETDQTSDCVVRTTERCTLTNALVNGGKVDLGVSPTNLTQSGGNLTVRSGAATAVVQSGGLTDWVSGGNVGTVASTNAGSRFRFTTNPAPKTVTTASFKEGAVLEDPQKSVTFANPISFDAQSLALSSLGDTVSIVRT